MEKLRVKSFKCAGNKKADSIKVTTPESKDVENFLGQSEVSGKNVEDPTRLSSVIPKDYQDKVEKALDKVVADLKNDEKGIENDLKLIREHPKYLDEFEAALAKAKRESTYEYKITGTAVIGRNVTEYEANKARCPNCKTMFLFHGSGLGAVSNIVTGSFRHGSAFMYGIGTYMSDSLECARYYSGGCIKPGSSFEFVASEIYYDQSKFENHAYEDSLKTSVG